MFSSISRLFDSTPIGPETVQVIRCHCLPANSLGIAILVGSEVNVVIEEAIGQDRHVSEAGTGTLSSRGVSDSAPAH